MNTKISYMYRDAANYKIHCEEVVKGEIRDEDREDLFENHPTELEEFYPATIGFKAPTFVTEGYKPYPDDPDTHEISDITLTESEPTVNMTVEDFVARVRSGFTSRPAFVVTKFGIILKEKPADEGLTVAEITEMLNKLDLSQQIFPVDIESKDSNSCALGFVTSEAYEAIDYDIRELDGFLKVRLFDTDSTTDFRSEYIFHDVRVHLSR